MHINVVVHAFGEKDIWLDVEILSENWSLTRTTSEHVCFTVLLQLR